MWKIVFAIFIVVFISCNNSIDNKIITKEKRKDSLDNIVNSKVVENENNVKKLNCNFDKIIQDPKTPKFAIDLLYNRAKNPSDNEPILYFEYFKSTDKVEREFYFRVVTNSNKVADGAYAEGLGYEGNRFVENNPKQFAAFFENTNCFTDDDLSVWAEILVGEFAIDNEGEYSKLITIEYINKLKSNCKGCSSLQIEILNKFGIKLEKKWKDYLNKID